MRESRKPVAEPPRKQPSDPCAECGSTDSVIQGKRFLSVEDEWRDQVLCQSCAAKLGPARYRSP